ncbi:Predicted Ser/Thr protein kinase [Halovenus aranensis]|uniref:Predicted Ser/Thr protein kinase n=1 Tax=Halovenus aranensis TaxID=890420 RepID=A0A1G8U5I0_9EURY|nr:kinase anchor protein [Halovenus aranensis]SDJ49007.1 Predicted Ser/Thr protein kinase [Halovenus aranensis]
MSGNDYIEAADRTLDATYEEPMSLEEYVETLLTAPHRGAHAPKYLLAAIESAGTRTVIEEGDEKERYRFFDDPWNDGEHAILGNTEVLNRFVDDLRSIAAGRGKEEKILWLDGPTATGKSELKRCLVNGLREFSKTEEGRRYTMEWNVAGLDSSPGLTYSDEGTMGDEDDWYESPVQSHPLTVFPEDVRQELVMELNERLDDHIPVRVDGEIDPFCREAYDYLEEQYRREGVEDLFSAATDRQHLRIKNFVVDVGRGIGILHSEDEGTPKERLVGSWMHGMLRELDSRGRKNPQAFSYDGVLSQGNGLLTIVEDASQHADLLQKLLNVPDEGRVKLDKGIGMDIDTQLVIISNPDLEGQLNQHVEREGQDPLKALKRRLDRHRFTYLTNLSLEAELLRRELTDETSVWDANTWDQLEEWIRAPLSMQVRRADKTVRERELAPHALKAAAMYAVVSRLDTTDLPDDISIVDKALLFDRGYLQDGDERIDIEDVEFEGTSANGEHGIPVTYTRDIIADLLHEESDRFHQEFDVESVIMPRDVLNAMAERLADAPVFSTTEAAEFEERIAPVKEYTFTQQEEDVLNAMMRDKRVDEATVEEYVGHVYAWAQGEKLENDRGERVDPDPLKMKVFEIEHLGRFTESDYTGNQPDDVVAEFRTEQIITALNRHAWRNRDEEFRVSAVNPKEIPAIKAVLGNYDWEDIKRTYEDFDPHQWDNPPTETQTERLKEETIRNMQELYDYSEATAELTSRHVMSQVSYKWS